MFIQCLKVDGQLRVQSNGAATRIVLQCIQPASTWHADAEQMSCRIVKVESFAGKDCQQAVTQDLPVPLWSTAVVCLHWHPGQLIIHSETPYFMSTTTPSIQHQQNIYTSITYESTAEVKESQQVTP